MQVLEANELERLVQRTFPAKRGFAVGPDLGLTPNRLPAVAFIHGGPDPYLDRQLDDWLAGGRKFVGLCSTGCAARARSPPAPMR
jgi:hypothetical protein